MPSPDISPPLSIPEALHALSQLPSGSAVLLLGDTDTGKTTFVREAFRLLSPERSLALVDCDLGQSEVGLPGTISAAMIGRGQWAEAKSLRELKPLSSYFVGAVSPSRHLLEVCVGACQMARVARKSRPELMLIDTCGFVAGGAAVSLKRRLAELLLPHTIVAFTRGAELDPLLQVFAHLKRPHLLQVSVPADLPRKTPISRATRRASRFHAALQNAQEITLDWDAVAMLGTRLGTGTPLAHHLGQFISQSLRLPVLHAEKSSDGRLLVVVNGDGGDPAGLSAVESYFRAGRVTVVSARRFAGLLVGLINASGALLEIGIIRRIDFVRRTLTLLTVCKKPGAIAQIWCGSLRLRPDGREAGEIKPGDI